MKALGKMIKFFGGGFQTMYLPDGKKEDKAMLKKSGKARKDGREEGFYLDRALGSHRHHRYFSGDALTGTCPGAGDG